MEKESEEQQQFENDVKNNIIEYCEEEEDYYIDTVYGRYYLEPEDILKRLNTTINGG